MSKEGRQYFLGINPHGVNQAAESGHRVHAEKHIVKENEDLEKTSLGNPVRSSWESFRKLLGLWMCLAVLSNLSVQNNLVEQMHGCEIGERKDERRRKFH